MSVTSSLKNDALNKATKLNLICRWETDFYQITLIATEPLKAFVHSLQSQKTYLIDVSPSFNKYSYIDLVTYKEKLHEIFYTHVVKQDDIPISIEIFTRGLGGGGFYTQRNDLPSDVLKGNADINVVPRSPQELVWVMRQLDRNDSRYKLYLKCSTQFLDDFANKTVHSKKEINDIVMLVLIDEKDISRAVINHLILRIKDDVILNIDLVEALADAIDRAQPTHLTPDDLIQLLYTAVQRIKITHSTDKKSQHEQLKAVARIINAMADTNVCNIPRQIHLDIAKLLHTFTNSDYPGVKHFASYAEEALKRVPDDEKKFAAFIRHATGVVKGVYYLWMAFKDMDPKHVVNCLLSMKGSAEDLIKFAKEIKQHIDIGNITQGVVNLKKGLTFVHSLEWYVQARYIELLIATNCFCAVELFLHHPNLKKHPSLMFIVLDKFYEVVLTHPDLNIRQETIALLRHIYIENEKWSALEIKDHHYKKEKPELTNLFHREAISDWIAIKGLIIEYLQEFQKIPSLTSSAESALQEIEKRVQRHPEETQFIHRHRIKVTGNKELSSIAAFPIANSHSSSLSEAKKTELFEKKPQKEMNLEARLEMVKNNILEDDSFKKDQIFYVEPLGVDYEGSTLLFDLKNEVLSFLKGNQRVLLLRGDSGSGKTIFCQTLAAHIWKQYQPTLGKIPLYVSLPSLKDPVHELFKNYMERHGFSPAEILKLKAEREIIFILDGYDEISKNADILEGNQLLKFNAKIIVTCRTEALPWIDLFIPTVDGKPKRSLLKEIYIAPFSTTQVDSYIEKCISMGNTEWKQVSIYKTHIQQISGLSELTQSPFILKIITDVLPEIVDRLKNSSSRDNPTITKYALYDAFIDEWFLREITRMKKHLADLEKVGIDPRNIRKEIILFCTQLANCFNTKGLTQVEFDSESTPEWNLFFGNDPKVSILRSMAPIKVTNDKVYSFIHKSLLEYFIALSTRTALAPNKNSSSISTPANDGTKPTSTPLQPAPLHTQQPPIPNALRLSLIKGYPIFNKLLDFSIWLFLADCVKEDAVFKQELFSLIEQSKNDSNMSIAAANAITILNLAQISFSKMNFRGVRIPGAQLEKANFVGTDLRDSNLTDVTLSESIMNYALLDRAIMKGVQFSQKPSIQVIYPFNNISLTADGKLNIFFSYEWDIIDIESSNIIQKIKYENLCYLTKSSDGKRAAFVSGYDIFIYDLQTGNLVQTLKTPKMREIRSAIFLNDKNCLAACSKDKVIRVWDLNTGELINELVGHTGRVTSYATLFNGNRLASASVDRTVRMWDLQTGQAVLQLDVSPPEYFPFTRDVPILLPFKDGCRLVVGSTDEIKIWDMQTKRLLQTLKVKGTVQNFALVNNDKTLILSLARDPIIYVWDVDTGQKIKTLQGHTAPIIDLLPFENGSMLASGSEDQTIRMWDLQFNQKRKHTQIFNESIAQIIPIDNDRKLVLIVEGKINIWDIQNKQVLQTKINDPQVVFRRHSVASSINGRMLASYCNPDEPIIEIYDSQTEQITKRLYWKKYFKSEIHDYVISNNGKRLITSIQQAIQIWDVQAEEITHQYENNRYNYHTPLAFFNDEKRLVVGAGHEISIWNLETGTVQKKLRTVMEYSQKLILFDNDKKLAVIGHKNYGGFEIIDLESGKKTDIWKKLEDGYHVYNGGISGLVPFKNNTILACTIISEKNTSSRESHGNIYFVDLVTEQVNIVIKQPFEITSLNVIKNNVLCVGDINGGLWFWHLEVEENNYSPALLFTTNPSLSCTGIKLNQIVNLSESNIKLMKQYGAID